MKLESSKPEIRRPIETNDVILEESYEIVNGRQSFGLKKKQHLTRVTTPGWSTCRKVQVVTNKLTGGMDPSFREERFEFRKGFRRRIRCLGESSFNLSTSAIIRWQVLHVTWAGSFFF